MEFRESVPFRILLFSTTFHGFTIGVQLLFNILGRPQPNFAANLAQPATLLAAMPLGIFIGGLVGPAGASSARTSPASQSPYCSCSGEASGCLKSLARRSGRRPLPGSRGILSRCHNR